jgi:hypothetical protein
MGESGSLKGQEVLVGANPRPIIFVEEKNAERSWQKRQRPALILTQKYSEWPLAGGCGIGIIGFVARETAVLSASRGGHGILAFRESSRRSAGPEIVISFTKLHFCRAG